MPQFLLLFYRAGGPRLAMPNIIKSKNMAKNTMKRIFAILAAVAAMPVKPNIAAMIAITKKLNAQ
jgi:hypothetical protein